MHKKTPIMKLSIINIAIKKSLNLVFTVLFTEIIHSGIINVVKIMNKIEIPSTPYFIINKTINPFSVFNKLKA